MYRIFIGFRCNNRCSFCAQGDLRDRVADVSPRPEQEILEAPPGAVVAFVGGEPTIHDDLLRWVALAVSRGASGVLVQTNGRRLADPRQAAELRAAGVSALDVSLHGSTAAMHDFHTGEAGSFAETLHGLRNARRVGLDVGVSTVVTRSNYRHLTEVVGLCHTEGCRAIHLAVAVPHGRAAASPDPAPPAALLRPHWAAALAHARSLGIPCVAAGGAPAHLAQGREWFAGIGVV